MMLFCMYIWMVMYNSVCFHSSEEENRFQCSSYEGILEVTAHSCQCKFWHTIHLPCRHIFSVRERTHCRLYCEELVTPRWTLDCIKAAYEVKHQSQDSESDCFEVCIYIIWTMHVYGFVLICHGPTILSTGNRHCPGARI